MKNLIYLILTTAVYSLSGQYFQWGIANAGNGDQLSKIVQVRNDIVYTVGSFQQSFDADPSASTYILSSQGQLDIFFIKYTTDGQLLEAYSLGGTGNEDYDPGFCIDPTGNFYFTFNFEGTIDADFMTSSVASYTAQNASDFLLAKYSPNGQLLWAHQFDELGTAETGYSIVATDSTVFFTGLIAGSADMDPGIGIHQLTSTGQDLVVASYSSTGIYRWAFMLENDHPTATGNNVCLDADGNLLVAGYFRGTNIDFDPGPGSFLMTQSSNFFDFFLAKYSHEGIFSWAHHTGANSDNVTYALKASGNDIIVGGYITGNTDLDPGSGVLMHQSKGLSDAYLARFASNGSLTWVKAFGSSGYDDVISLDISTTGNIVVTGGFQGDTMVVETGDTLFSPSSDSQFDAYVAEFDPSGNCLWTMSYGDANYDQGSDVSIDEFNNWYLTGNISTAADLDPSVDIALINGIQGNDQVLFKLSPCIRMRTALSSKLRVKEDESVSIALQVQQGNPVRFIWYKDGTLIQEQSAQWTLSPVQFEDRGMYQAQLEDACENRIRSTSLSLEVLPSIKVYELLSPNNDQRNDYFHIRHITLDVFKDHEIVILNRWGQKVFESKAYQNDWEGDNLPEGNYFYFVKVGEEEFSGRLVIKR
ncbi:MAG: gliding motility-associated C-terminal domain-containing protein [Cytophagaceae bacterium]|nr:gliding motility-associated C-terminal domain-containing protein [Cytophagaceae bacterium]